MYLPFQTILSVNYRDGIMTNFHFCLNAATLIDEMNGMF